MVLEQLKLLINLATIDGEVAEKERRYIVNIGAANRVGEDVVQQLFGEKHDIIVPANLTEDQKFQYIVSLVHLMKIDERLYREEIKFCGKVAARLGYDQTVLVDLMLNISSSMAAGELEGLKKITAKYLYKP